MSPPAIELIQAVASLPAGRALDLACGRGRHAAWLRDHGWKVTAADLVEPEIDGVTCIQADLERGEFPIEPAAWDLIVCWLYWQEDLLPIIREGIREGGIAALAGKRTGRFATSLANYRYAFAGWKELIAGEDDYKAFYIARTSSG